MASNEDEQTTNTPGASSMRASQTHLTLGLESLWKTRAQADIIVCIEDKEIRCHKALLMAASPYFEAMFN